MSAAHRELVAVAAAHSGAARDSEAAPGTCYVKVALAEDAGAFGGLLLALEEYAASQGCLNVRAGVNLCRSRAYDEMRRAGFRPTQTLGLMMQWPAPTVLGRGGGGGGAAGPAAAGRGELPDTYNHCDAFVICDLC